jgi:CRP-like cAMP-binding protein
MAKATSSHSPHGNRLLARLAPVEHKRLLPLLKAVELESDHVLHKARTPFVYAYFPTRAVSSYLRVMEDGSAIEIGTVGNEGMVGVSGALGAPESPYQIIIQVAGEALRVEVKALAAEVDRSAPLRRLLVTYQAAFHTQVSQSVACNGLHPINQRCCRWLLMTHDRVGAEVLPLTHEYLAMMLGVRRASVTEVLGPLRDRGLISYSRGSITVVDRKGLEAAACECYQAVIDEYDRLFN